MPQLVWGAGLSLVFQYLTSLGILIRVATISLPTVLARRLPPSAVTNTFLSLPAPLRISLPYLTFVLIRHTTRAYQRHLDKKRLGPDVVEAPQLRMRWPLNIDFIPFVLHNRQVDYCAGMFTDIYREYGYTVRLGIFGQDQIATSEPEYIKAILSTDFTSFEKGPRFKRKMFSVLGTGDMWKFHRSMSRPYFTRDRISHFDLFARHSDAAISKLLARLSEPSSPPVDFQDVVARFTLDSGTEFLFGRDIHSLDAPLPYPHAPTSDDSASFAAAFGRAQEMTTVRFSLGPLWPFAEMFSDRTRADMKVIDAYVKPILKEKLEEKKSLGQNMRNKEDKSQEGVEDGDDTLLDHLVRFTDDEKVIKDEIINILVAGRDTTAATLTFAVYLLATHPHAMAKLRAEILEHVGSTNYPTPENFREMKYLRAVINETLRLFPPVPLNERTAVKSTVFRSGGKAIYIPEGTNVTYSVLHMHRRKDLWGPDADDFDPERWIDGRLKKYLTPNPFIFLPFNAGPRICLGQQFAYNESSFFLVRLLQRVKSVSLAPEAHPEGTLPPKEWQNSVGRKAYEKVWPRSHLTIYCNGGLWVRMKEAVVAAE